jgi:ubiquinone/menaquinone biosynthesis C-methylase UbiE
VLDVGTGGGSTLLAALRCVGPSGEVVGIDRREEWVTHTKNEIKRIGIHNADIILKDATDTELPDCSFDYALSGFLGWGHCFDFTKNKFTGSNLVLKEMIRLLKPGGRIGISSWLLQEDTEWMEEFVQSLSHPAKRTYVKETIEGWQQIEQESGLYETILLPEYVEYCYSTLDEWWEEMMSYSWKQQLDSLMKKKGISLDELKKSAFEQVQDRKTGEGVTFGRKVLFVLSTKKK